MSDDDEGGLGIGELVLFLVAWAGRIARSTSGPDVQEVRALRQCADIFRSIVPGCPDPVEAS